MRNGMLAKSYAVAYMNIERTEFCLGQDAIKYQLQKATEEKQDLLKERHGLQKQKDQIHTQRTALKQIDWKAENEMKKLKDVRDALIREIGGCEKDEQAKQDDLKRLSGEVFVREQEYSEKCLKHLELKAPMLEEYENQRAKRDIWLVITEKTVRNLKGEVEECVRQMETK